MTLRTGACLALAATLLSSTPVIAQETVADLDTAVRCAVVFGLIAGGQEQGSADALAYPPMEERGREFFVQVGARLIDERGLTTEQVAGVLLDQANALIDQAQASHDPEGAMRSVAEPCLVLLDATIPAELPRPRS